ncbi:MAG: hypothetical protein ACTHMC_06485 [Pseudobacter sp.]
MKAITGQFMVLRQPDNLTAPDREEEQAEEKKETKSNARKRN